MYIPEYRCIRCKHVFTMEKPGPVVQEWRADKGACPQCGWLYVHWLNYDELAKENRP